MALSGEIYVACSLCQQHATAMLTQFAREIIVYNLQENCILNEKDIKLCGRLYLRMILNFWAILLLCTLANRRSIKTSLINYSKFGDQK